MPDRSEFRALVRERREPALVLFDLDEVLVDYDHAARLALLAERSGASPEQVHAVLVDSRLEHESDLGMWQPSELAAEFTRRLGAPVKLTDFVDARAASMRLRPDVLAIARAAARHAEVGILTNNGLYLRDALPVVCPGLLPLFEGKLHLGADYGLVKPDPEVYLTCVRTRGFEPGQAVFIDDRPVNVEGAIAAGLDAILFTDVASLVEALAARGLVVIEHAAAEDGGL